MPTGLEHADYKEVQALQALRDATNFAGWHNTTGWDDETLLQSTENTVGVTIEYGHVTRLDLSYNSLRGEIPSEIEELKWLEELLLHGNELHGPLPAAIHGLHKLSWINFSENHFSGPIPDLYDDLTVLRVFKCGHNELCGPISDFWSRFTALFELDLSGNNFDVSDLESTDFIIDFSSLESIKEYIARRESEGGEDLTTWGMETFPNALIGMSFRIPQFGVGGPDVSNEPHLGIIKVTSIEGLQGYFEKVQINGILNHVYSLEANVHWEAQFAGYDDEDLQHSHRQVTGHIVYPDMGSQCYPVFHTELEWNAPRPIGRQFEVLKHYIGTPSVGLQQSIMTAIGSWHNGFIKRFPEPRALKVCYQCPYKEFFAEQEIRLKKLRQQQKHHKHKKHK